MVKASPRERSPDGHAAARLAFGWRSDDVGPSGVIGDPTGATAERGEEQFGAIVAALGDALAEVARFSPPAGRSG